MTRKLDNNNCFYCQSLDNNFLKIGSCAFCKAENPLYLVNYQNQKKYFCYGCAWWYFPRSEKEKGIEERWYKRNEKKATRQGKNDFLLKMFR